MPWPTNHLVLRDCKIFWKAFPFFWVVGEGELLQQNLTANDVLWWTGRKDSYDCMFPIGHDYLVSGAPIRVESTKAFGKKTRGGPIDDL